MISKEEKEKLFAEFKDKLFNQPIEVEINSSGELPTYNNIGDSGLDLRASEDINIKPLETKVVPTGIKISLPKNVEAQIRARSGISLHTPLRISNGIGTIDGGYNGEIGIIITNTSINQEGVYTIDEKNNRQGTYYIKKGSRIAQLVFTYYVNATIKVVEKLENKNDRGGGFGHTGTI
ncbi:MAG: dUTP diphosphatase [bacterium]|nr:dUTP diphosphatase [bacterium]